MKDILYFYSQGIIAIVVALFILTQKQAIFNESEKFTAGLFREVAKTDLKFVQKLVELIREGKHESIEDYEDIVIDINTLIENHQVRTQIRDKIRKAAQRHKQSIADKTQNIKELIAAECEAFGVFKNLGEKRLREIIDVTISRFGVAESIEDIKLKVLGAALQEEEQLKMKKSESKNGKKTVRTLQDGDLIKLFEQSKKQGKHIYDLLNEHEYIKEPLDDFVIYGINEGISNFETA